MGLFEQMPYSNFHELNADWLLRKMKELETAMETFKATESLKFADPIIWDITTQYEKSTVVLDPSGNAYLSLQAVPAGIQLNNDEYWLEIFNFTDYTRTANQNLTINTETNTTRATAPYQVDDWLIWNDVLYRVTSPIAIDDALIVAPAAGSNIIHFTVEDFIKAFITYATGLIQQYKNDIDASELTYRQQLAQDIANTTASLQAQLDQAISGATVDSEVINARIGADGITYTTLGDAIRTQMINIADDNEIARIIPATLWQNGYRVTNSATVGAPSANADYRCCIIPCSEGDRFNITASGHSTTAYRAWAFADSTNTVLTRAASVEIVEDADLIAPANTAYLVLNDYDASHAWSRRCFYNFKILPYLEKIAATILTFTRNYSGANVDFDTFKSGWCRVYSTTSPANSPINDPFGIVFTFNDGSTSNQTQLYIGYRDGLSFIRFSSGSGYGAWYQLTYGINPIHYIDSLTGASVDFDTLAEGWYRIYSTTSPANSPVDDPYGFVICTTDSTNPASNLKTQIYIAYRTSQVFIRFLSAGTWQPWSAVGADYSHVITINSSDDLYNIIKNAPANSHIIINAGTYDISAQMQAESDSYNTDIHIKNDSWIEGRGNPKIICNLSSKRDNNSVFFFDGGGHLSKLSGIVLEATNTRYAIHDDYANNDPTNQWSHIIENCNIKYTGIVGSSGTDGRCIGGGMGVNVTNIIEGCIFEDTNTYPVDYHTNSAAVGGGTVNGASKVEIKDNYFITGSARCRGLADDLTANRDTVLIHNNRGTIPFIVTGINNTIIPYIWNNVVE